MHVVPSITNPLANWSRICIAKSIAYKEHRTASSKQFGCKPSQLQGLSAFPLGNELLFDLKSYGIKAISVQPKQVAQAILL